MSATACPGFYEVLVADMSAPTFCSYNQTAFQ